MTRPFVGSYTPVMQLKAVVLPAPFGPMSATICPSGICSDRLLTATTPPNCIVIFSTLRMSLLICFALLNYVLFCLFRSLAEQIRQFALTHDALAEEEHDDHDDD